MRKCGIGVVAHPDILGTRIVPPHIHHVLVFVLVGTVQGVLPALDHLVRGLESLLEIALGSRGGRRGVEAHDTDAGLLAGPAQAALDSLVVLGYAAGIVHRFGLHGKGGIFVGIPLGAGRHGKIFRCFVEVTGDLVPGLFLAGARDFHRLGVEAPIYASACQPKHLGNKERSYQCGLLTFYQDHRQGWIRG